MIHDQEPWPAHNTRPRFYAYCRCGVCGPLRAVQKDARADELAHDEVCSSKARAA